VQSDSTLHEMLKFSLAYRAKSVILHEKRKGPFSLQPVAYVVMVRQPCVDAFLQDDQLGVSSRHICSIVF
jgi:hypothetical protein